MPIGDCTIIKGMRRKILPVSFSGNRHKHPISIHRQNPVSIVHIKMLQHILFLFRSGIPMTHLQHRHKSQCGKDKRIREQCPIRNPFQQETGKHRCKYLCRHRKSIVSPCKFPDITSLAHFHYHRIGIDINCRPSYTDCRKSNINNRKRLQGRQRRKGSPYGYEVENGSCYLDNYNGNDSFIFIGDSSTIKGTLPFTIDKKSESLGIFSFEPYSVKPCSSS